MNCIFLRRGYGTAQTTPPAATPIPVTITGSGNATYCYATIGGTSYYGAGTYEVMAGDVITFGVYGRSTTYTGKVTIDGTDVLSVTNQTTQTYEWTVPDGVTAIAIAMSYTSSSYQRRGTITVTTTKGSSGGGSGGGGASEYAVTIVDDLDSLEDDIASGFVTITLGGTKITKAGTYTAKKGDVLRYVCEPWEEVDVYNRVTVNGTVVAEKTVDQDFSYSHTISSTTNVSYKGEQIMYSYYYIWAITTE